MIAHFGKKTQGMLDRLRGDGAGVDYFAQGVNQQSLVVLQICYAFDTLDKAPDGSRSERRFSKPRRLDGHTFCFALSCDRCTCRLHRL